MEKCCACDLRKMNNEICQMTNFFGIQCLDEHLTNADQSSVFSTITVLCENIRDTSETSTLSASLTSQQQFPDLVTSHLSRTSSLLFPSGRTNSSVRSNKQTLDFCLDGSMDVSTRTQFWKVLVTKQMSLSYVPCKMNHL